MVSVADPILLIWTKFGAKTLLTRTWILPYPTITNI